MRSSKVASWSIICGLALRAGAADAQTPPAAPVPWPEAAPPFAPAPAPAPAAPTETRWYGWQTLLADVGAVTLTMVAATSAGHDDDAAALRAALIGGSAFLFGGPAIHAAHGHWQTAGISFALRLGAPLIAAGIAMGVAADSCGQYEYDHEGCTIGPAAAAFSLGALTAMILDASVLGRDQIPARTASTPSVAFTPLRSGGGLSLVGRF